MSQEVNESGKVSAEPIDQVEKPNQKVQKAVLRRQIIEVPKWAAALMETGTKSLRHRLVYWGTLIALTIITFISLTSLYFTQLWMPLDDLYGWLNLSTFLLWNVLTLSNFYNASILGPGYVPTKWKPENVGHEEYLQYCKPCEGFKVPRSHHCSKCQRCCMKMDHHCPWINNCVGHRNHSYFVRFLFFAVVGCVHAVIIMCFTFYHALHLGWYVRYGNGTEPIIVLDLVSFFSMVITSALAAGVAIALSALLVCQLKYIKNNKNGIEEYIDTKSRHRSAEGEWVYPYDLGWRRNLREVLGSWSGETAGNGTWWPVLEGCDQFTFTIQQLYLKQWKREHSRTVTITKGFSGTVCASRPHGCAVFCRQPLIDGAATAVEEGDRLVITRISGGWVYGHRELNEAVKGWVPVVCTDLPPLRPRGTKSADGGKED